MLNYKFLSASAFPNAESGINSKFMKETLASIEEMSAAQAAFSYKLLNNAISSCVFGTTRINNLIEIIEPFGKKILILVRNKYLITLIK